MEASPCVRNLCVLLDSFMNMEKHINLSTRSAYMHLRHIGSIRGYLTPEATKSLVYGLVTSRLDYCNSLLAGIPKTQIAKLQRVQNTAARIITRSPRCDHIRPVLRELHWLPVSSRIEFKILMITFKALLDLAPSYIKYLLIPYKASRTLQSQNSQKGQ